MLAIIFNVDYKAEQCYYFTYKLSLPELLRCVSKKLIWQNITLDFRVKSKDDISSYRRRKLCVELQFMTRGTIFQIS